jgi:ribosomal protein S13
MKLGMSDTQLLALAEMEISDQRKIISDLRYDHKVMVAALNKIKNEDYRGNRHSEVFIAKAALQKLLIKP